MVKLIDSKYIQLEMQKNLTIIPADVSALPEAQACGVFPVQLCTVFFRRPVPVRVRR